MVEDRLSHDERVRLEALAQANGSVLGRAEPATIIEVAKAYEIFLRTGTNAYSMSKES